MTQNSAVNQFRPYEIDTSSIYIPKTYPLIDVDIPVRMVSSLADITCPPQQNFNLMNGIIPDFSYAEIAGRSHVNLIANNDASFFNEIINYLPFEAIAVENQLLCPIVPIIDPDE